MIKGLQCVSCEERLRELELFRLEMEVFGKILSMYMNVGREGAKSHALYFAYIGEWRKEKGFKKDH